MHHIPPHKKKYIQRQAYRKFQYELKKKRWTVDRKRKILFVTVKNRRNKKFFNNPEKIEHKKYKAPLLFSLTENPLSVIDFFKKVEKTLSSNIRVMFDLSDVTEMGPETLLYYCAFINEGRFTKGNMVLGNTPIKPELKEMFMNAGFYKYVIPKSLEGFDKTISNDDIIHKITMKKVESELAAEVCDSAILHTFGKLDKEKRKFQIILVESMANTNNHAGGRLGKEIYNWWLLAYKDPLTKSTKFCFLDLGIGIFKSLEIKYEEANLSAWLAGKVFPRRNKKTLSAIFGGSKETSTRIPGRGLGIKYIYDKVKDNPNIKNFTLLSNDIIAKIGYNTKDKIEKIQNNFEGTLYYWELVK